MKSTIGQDGESKATSFLQNIGYTILKKNFRSRFGEIDIIAKDEAAIVFVEVKTRSSSTFGSPSEAIGYHKLSKLIKTSEYFLLQFKKRPAYRYDAIEVFYDTSGHATINHIKNITL